jgi:DNA polymerase/3'-5' exonuclease PolX
MGNNDVAVIPDRIDNLSQINGEIKITLGLALPLAEELLEYVESCEAVGHVQLTGSVRRRKNLVGDIDIVAATDHPLMLIEHLKKYCRNFQ